MSTPLTAKKMASQPTASCIAAACALTTALATGAAFAQPTAADAPIEVSNGDSFSAIAARILGSPRQWSTLYDPRLTGLRDPNKIAPGQRFELVTEPGGKRYLRLIGTAPATTTAAVAPARAPAVAAAPVTAPAPAPARAPAVAAAPAPAPAPAPASARAPAAARAVAAAPAPAPVAPAPAPVAAAPAPLAAAPAPVAAAATGEELVIGVLPNIGAAALLAQYDNLKSWMERTQGTKVRITVPPNFKAFFDATMRGDYDLSVAAPHFARLAQVDRGLLPVVMYEPRISALFIGKPDDGLNGPADLRGKSLGFANPTSLVALYGLQWFRQNGLEPGKDFEVRGARTDMGVGRMLLTGEVTGAVMSNGEFRALPQDESSRLRTIEAFARIPNFIVVAHPRLGAARINRLKTQFKSFIADKDEGAAFSKASGITGMVDADDAVLKELDPYVMPTRRVMGMAN